MKLLNNFIRYLTSLINRVLQIMLDVGLLGDALVLWQDVRERREVVGFGVLNCVRPEYVDSRRVDINPLVPTSSPSVIMYVNGVFSYLRYLSLQPLIYGVFDIKPHPNFKLSFAKVELRNIRELVVVLALSSDPDSISKSTILGLE